MTAWIRTPRMIVLLAIAACAFGAAGCNEDQLKQEIATLDARLELCKSEKQALAGQRSALQSQNAQLQTDLSEAQRQLAEERSTVVADRPPDFGEGIEVSEDARQITVTLPNAILFDSGKATLKSASKGTLDTIAGVIRRDYSGKMVRIEGHTDSDPIRKSKWKDNWELSCQRALAVLRHLVGRGIPTTQVYAAGFGQHTPRDSNATAAGKARNRRVQVVIIK